MTLEEEVRVGAEVDVAALMGEVRGEVRRKREAGLYPPDVSAEVDDVLIADSSRGDEFAALFADLRKSAGINLSVPIASHGAMPSAVVLRVKRVIAKGIRWYVAAIADQFSAFAWKVVRALNSVANRQRQLQDRVAELEGRIERLENKTSG
jgi:ubiquinone biosynthesis protein UbiJ